MRMEATRRRTERRLWQRLTLLACTAVALVAAIAPAASAATLVGFGAAPSSGDGTARPGDSVDYTIRADGDGSSSFVVSVNGDQVAKGEAFPGITAGQFVMPDVNTSADNVTVGVSLDDPASEPRTIAIPYASGAPSAGDKPAAEQEANSAPSAATPEPTSQPEPEPAPSAPPETAAGGDAPAAPAATAAAPAVTAPKAAAPSTRPRARRRPAQRTAPARPTRRPAAPAPQSTGRRAGALHGRVGDGSLSGLPAAAGSSRRAVPAQGARAQQSAHPTPPRHEAAPAAPPATPGTAGGTAGAKDQGSSATLLLVVLAVLAAAVAGAAALRLHTRSKQRYDEFLGPVATPPTRSGPRPSEPLNLTGAGVRDQDP